MTERSPNNYPPQQRENLIWCAVDFDGTLAHSTWSVTEPNALPGEPIWNNVAKLIDLIDSGMKIVIHTSRGWADYELVESYLQHYNIPFDKIVCGKLLAAVYCDDRAVNASEDQWI